MARGVQVYKQATAPSGSQVQIGDLWVKPGAIDTAYLCTEVAPGGVSFTQIGQGVPAQTYDVNSTYSVGTIVEHQGGFWRATGAVAADSTPISGNTDWTLVAGTPYVDVVLTPPELTGAEFNDLLVGLVLIPSPGPGQQVLLDRIIAQATFGDAWSSVGTFSVAYDAGNGQGIPRLVSQNFVGLDDVDTTGIRGVYVAYSSESNPGDTSGTGANDAENQPLKMWTDSVMIGGTRSWELKAYYTIERTSQVQSPSFFTITAVNDDVPALFVAGDPDFTDGDTFTVVGNDDITGEFTVDSSDLYSAESRSIVTATALTKTFTVAGNHAAVYPVGIKFTVSGGGNNIGDYTVVSATFTSSTAIVVNETVTADSMASGTIAYPETTRIITTEPPQDTTVAGWIEVA